MAVLEKNIRDTWLKRRYKICRLSYIKINNANRKEFQEEFRLDVTGGKRKLIYEKLRGATSFFHDTIGKT